MRTPREDRTGTWTNPGGDYDGTQDHNTACANVPRRRRRRNFRAWCRCQPDPMASGEASYYDFRRGGPDYGKGPESNGHGWTCDRCGRVTQTG